MGVLSSKPGDAQLPSSFPFTLAQGGGGYSYGFVPDEEGGKISVDLSPSGEYTKPEFLTKLPFDINVDGGIETEFDIVDGPLLEAIANAQYTANGLTPNDFPEIKFLPTFGGGGGGGGSSKIQDQFALPDGNGYKFHFVDPDTDSAGWGYKGLGSAIAEITKQLPVDFPIDPAYLRFNGGGGGGGGIADGPIHQLNNLMQYAIDKASPTDFPELSMVPGILKGVGGEYGQQEPEGTGEPEALSKKDIKDIIPSIIRSFTYKGLDPESDLSALYEGVDLETANFYKTIMAGILVDNGYVNQANNLNQYILEMLPGDVGQSIAEQVALPEFQEVIQKFAGIAPDKVPFFDAMKEKGTLEPMWSLH